MEDTIEIMDEKLADDLWLIRWADKSLAFAPLRGKVFLVKQKGWDALRSFFRGNYSEDIEKFLDKNGLMKNAPCYQAKTGKPYIVKSLVLSLTTGCNLRCIYCYADAVSNGQKMPETLAKSAIDIATAQARQSGSNQLRVLFHGGGEALTEWKVLKSVTEYAENTWNGDTRFGIVTNGTLITPSRADWFKKHNFNVTVSLDGTEDIQNVQRPMANGRGSYKACIYGIKLLRDRNISCGIRATITSDNVGKIDEMVRVAAELGCRLKVEPITPIGRGKTGIKAPNIIDFVDSLQNALSLAKEYNVRLSSTYLPGLKPKTSYCAANGEMLVLLPNGDISCCSRVTKQEDSLSKVFFIGQIQDDKLKVSNHKVEILRKLHVQEFEQCVDCFAKWHCAGGCYNTRLSSDGNMPKEHCDLSRWLLWTELWRKANMKGGENYERDVR